MLDDDDVIDEPEEGDQNQELDDYYVMSAIEKKYQFLMKGQLIKSKDAPNVLNINGQSDKENAISYATSNYMEMNNKLIEDCFTVFKKREYAQLHLGDYDLNVLEMEDVDGFQKALSLIKNQ